jgi:signal transduction histidine kinase
MRRTAIEALKSALDWANPRVAAGGRALRAGLVQVATTPDPPPVWRGKWRRRLAYGTVGLLSVLLVPAALSGLFGGLSLLSGIPAVLPVWLWFGGPNADMGRVAATIAFAAAAIAVDALSSRRRAQRDLAEQAELTELEQARRAVLTERTRIARELHDVVAHHMSLIAVRAETAPYRLSEVDEPARAEFLALSGAAREALTDMRRLLGVLHDDGPAGRAPQPQVPDLQALLASARLAGMAVARRTCRAG